MIIAYIPKISFKWVLIFNIKKKNSKHIKYKKKWRYVEDKGRTRPPPYKIS